MSKKNLRNSVKQDLEYYEGLSLFGAAWSVVKGVFQMFAMLKDFIFVTASTEKNIYSEKYYDSRLRDEEEDDESGNAKSKRRKPNFFDD